MAAGRRADPTDPPGSPDDMETVDAPAPRSPFESLPPAAGTHVGRYLVLQPIASGGMGSVLLAYDTQLARRVALKTLLAAPVNEEGRERLMREAQAMARLSHPNVVSIYDVFVHGGSVFLAMEYIEGITLRDWMKAPHSRREVLSVMKQAGRGLSAAHASGLVHRDFKPSNVVVAKDGRVCVLDFGIARGVRQGGGTRMSGSERRSSVPPPDETAARPSASAAPLLDYTLTQAGSFLGTVGFAAPEVMLGLSTDARADVFGFSVTLWRALYGQLPFATDDVPRYLREVEDGKPAMPADARVPRWLHDVMVRGLAHAPKDRFSSIDAMMAALDANPWRSRAALGTLVATLAVASAALLARQRHEANLRTACRVEGEALAAIWTPAARQSAERAMLAEPDAFAGERTTSTLERLDDYVRAWTMEQTASCQAARITKSQPETAHAKRSQCLLEGRTEFEVAIETLASASPLVHRQSLGIANNLPSPRLCTATAQAERSALASSGPGVTARRELMRASLLRVAGDFGRAQEAAENALRLARQATDSTLEARAEYVLGLVLEGRFQNEETMDHLTKAASLAESVGADHTAGMAAVEIAFVLHHRFHQSKEAGRWREIARAKLGRLGGDFRLELKVTLSDYTYLEDREPRRALEVNERAIDLTRQVYGETHSAFCAALNNRGTLYVDLGDPASAAEWYARGIACEEKATGPHNASLAAYYSNFAEASLARGLWEDAMAAARHGAKLREGVGPRDPLLTTLLAGQALGLFGSGRLDEAEEVARRAVELNGNDVSEASYALGCVLLARGDARGARDACARAVSEGGPPAAPEQVYEYDALRCLGEAELARGNVAAARQSLEESVARPNRFAPGDLALARFALARALASSSRGAKADLPRALHLAEEARDELLSVAQTHPFRKRQLDEVQRWVDELHSRSPLPR